MKNDDNRISTSLPGESQANIENKENMISKSLLITRKQERKIKELSNTLRNNGFVGANMSEITRLCIDEAIEVITARLMSVVKINNKGEA